MSSTSSMGSSANSPLLRSSAVPTAVSTQSASLPRLLKKVSGSSQASHRSSESTSTAAAKSVSLVIDSAITEKMGCTPNSAVMAASSARGAPRLCTKTQA